ncbi:hypothetical protein BDK51DRAFT_42284 [Blyttiomyces helicus]|uniref:Uncharacterized protein n=1 Tax=Blyttiomyces helicus TaxID=388810 RepID=A0A4V1IQ94_9FUNG|nr:hypothetical protein BDK51DRAFT_42284 [Blyttiomyces helicus]|eukprot:RKO85767.1 hypothetical protein BDK51DRAFT_42284 [Blyttiomyces helicus]
MEDVHEIAAAKRLSERVQDVFIHSAMRRGAPVRLGLLRRASACGEPACGPARNFAAIHSFGPPRSCSAVAIKHCEVCSGRRMRENIVLAGSKVRKRAGDEKREHHRVTGWIPFRAQEKRHLDGKGVNDLSTCSHYPAAPPTAQAQLHLPTMPPPGKSVARGTSSEPLSAGRGAGVDQLAANPRPEKLWSIEGVTWFFSDPWRRDAFLRTIQTATSLCGVISLGVYMSQFAFPVLGPTGGFFLFTGVTTVLVGLGFALSSSVERVRVGVRKFMSDDAVFFVVVSGGERKNDVYNGRGGCGF